MKNWSGQGRINSRIDPTGAYLNCFVNGFIFSVPVGVNDKIFGRRRQQSFSVATCVPSPWFCGVIWVWVDFYVFFFFF